MITSSDIKALFKAADESMREARAQWQASVKRVEQGEEATPPMFDVETRKMLYKACTRKRGTNTTGSGKRSRIAQIHPEVGVIKVWDSMVAAEKAGFCRASISQVCNGNREHHFGCSWMRVR